MPIEKFGWNKQSMWGFVWHQAIGAVCFFFDLGVIFLLIRHGHLYYPVAVAVGFVAATLLNYVLTRSTIYSKSERDHTTAVTLFFAVGIVLLMITVGGTIFMREVVGLKLYIARTLVGIFVGITGFLIDCLVTFKLR